MKVLIVNADDFGYGSGVNRGIVCAHSCGIVTSASLMVNTPGTREAVALAAEMPALSLGLHVNFTNEAQRLVPFEDPCLADRELRRQFDRFVALVGRRPTHIDAHQHVHRSEGCIQAFRRLAREYGLPLREQPPVTFKGGFYAQWEYGVSDPTKVSFEALAGILSREITDGIYELAVHPGYYDPSAEYVYHQDRELELQALVDPRVRDILRGLDIELVSYRDLPAETQGLARPA